MIGGAFGSLPAAEMAIVLRMLTILALGTWAARPISLRLVPGGGGWIFALLLAWAMIGWVPWALSALGIVPLGPAGLAGLVLLLVMRARHQPPAPDPKGGLATAVGFCVLFWLGLAQRLGRADLSGLEKFTDMSFLSATMRADWMPPQDAWYAGITVNYYYVGQAMSAVWGNLAGAPADAAYQIAMAKLFALTGLAVFRLTAGLAVAQGRRIASVLGGAAALLALYGGNFHSVLYTTFRNRMPTTKEAFYYPDSTRFIGFDPPSDDKGFTEFTGYAFAVGDLHAHVVATPLFFLGLLIVLAIMSRGITGKAPDLWQSSALGWVLGLCVCVNAWDFAVLGLVSLIAALVLALRPGSNTAGRLDRLGAAAVVVLATAFVTAAPFLATFSSFASGVELAPARSPLWQLFVLYSHILPAAGLFLLFALRHSLPANAFAIPLLFVAAVVLLAIPESVIVRDIYGLDFARANTMFKLSFRAQSLLVIAGFAALAPAVVKGGKWLVLSILAAAPLVSPLLYASHIFSPPSSIRTLDGLAFLGEERGLVDAAGRFGLSSGRAIIEASGDAFGETGRVSAMTGQPSVIGWAGHQWLWRGDGETPNRRAANVRLFYTTTDPAERCRVIKQYGIELVILAQVETRQYPDLKSEAIAALGPIIHQSAGGQIVQISPDACH